MILKKEQEITNAIYAWDEKSIARTLDYCIANEIRVKTAKLYADNLIVGLIEKRSVTYTVKEVNYLSLSELCISLAQLSQLFADYFFSHSENYSSLYPDLISARINHQIYYTNMNCTFNHRITDDYYYLKIELIRAFKIGNVFGMKFKFSVCQDVIGETLCTMPLKKYSDN
jgi:hypothetical protein